MNAEPTVYPPESLTEVSFIDLQTTSSEKARARKKFKRNLLILFNLVFAGFILLPLLYAVSVAFMPSNELFTTEVNLLPQTITLNNFKVKEDKSDNVVKAQEYQNKRLLIKIGLFILVWILIIVTIVLTH